jgi:ATP-binding cassette subfamily C protein LapB
MSTPQSNNVITEEKNQQHDIKDPLLSCLALLASLLNRSVSEASLRSGFATDNEGRVAFESYPEIARLNGLVAAWSKMQAASAPSYVLPIIVPFIDGRCCVLLAVNDQEVEICLPESGKTVVKVSLAEFNALAKETVLVVKAATSKSNEELIAFRGQAFSWFWGTLWRFRRFYAESMLATVLANILTLASVFFTMTVYDRVVPTQAYTSLWTLAIGTLIAVGLEFLMRWLKARLVDLGGRKADLAINSTLLREIMTIRLEHRPQSVGIFASSMRDFEALRDFFSSASLVLVADLPFVILFLALISIVGGPIFWLPALAVPVLIIIGLLIQRPLMRAIRDNMKEAGDRQSILVESVLNLEMLKAHNAESYLQTRWEKANLASADSYKRTRSLTNFVMGLTGAVQQAVTVGMVVWGVYLIESNSLSLGGLIASVILAGRAIAPLSSIMSLAARYQQAATSLKTLDGLMKRPRDRDNDKKYISLTDISGKLSAQELVFNYPSENKVAALNKATLLLEGGDRVGLLGRVGSGKSTLLRVMSGLYHPASGSVSVDDVDIRQIDPASLRTHIGYIGQDPQLFMGTLRENLVLSDIWLSDFKIIETLKALDLYGIVAAHPRGLDMPLTESGGGLSGGQRQLVTVARMMLRDPKFVFMDEPTAHMDQNTEAIVIRVLESWMRGRTVLLATHRPQLLKWVNKIAVIEQGQIALVGPRDEVLQKLSKPIDARPANTTTGQISPPATSADISS